MNENGLERLEGTVEHIIYYNGENGYTICDLALSDDEIITAVGEMPMLGEGDRLCLFGKWTHNPKYGRQFSVSQYERTMPSAPAAMLKYLSSRAIKGIGPITAKRIVDEFGEDTFNVLENHPEWLANIKGISMRAALSASESFKEQAGVRSAMIFFRDYFGVATTLKIYKKWGTRAVELAKRNPYRLCNEIEGIGFEGADRVASSLGLTEDNLERIKSGIDYVLMKNEIANGHTCLPREMLISGACELLGVSADAVHSACDELVREGRLVEIGKAEGNFIYRLHTYDAERYIAEKLLKLDRLCASVDTWDISGFIAGEEAKSGIVYAELQKKAIADALRFGVMVLTGGPGTGKTTVVRALIHIFENMGFDIALAAPTGRAAKRMSEATSREAKTIHRLLEMSYDASGSFKFCRNADCVLDEQIIIVDEASMIDNALMCALTEAIKPGARFIIIGDSDQLPSVGAGNVLRDIIDSGKIATVRLNEIFRQASASLIITNAHAINSGEQPRLDIKDNDFFYLARRTDREIAATVADLCLTRLPRTYGDMGKGGTQVICPSRKGEAGTESLNLLLQERLNPAKPNKREYKFRERVFREGDKIMQIRNNYELLWKRVTDESKQGNGIFNGDIGTVEYINAGESQMSIIFDDKRVLYDFSLLDELEHAYAVTVHKSQGSEYPIVIIPACSAPSVLLTRNLLYTAVTRAQNMVIIVGREDIIRQMVENERRSMRYTGLCRMLLGGEK